MKTLSTPCKLVALLLLILFFVYRKKLHYSSFRCFLDYHWLIPVFIAIGFLSGLKSKKYNKTISAVLMVAYELYIGTWRFP